MHRSIIHGITGKESRVPWQHFGNISEFQRFWNIAQLDPGNMQACQSFVYFHLHAGEKHASCKQLCHAPECLQRFGSGAADWTVCHSPDAACPTAHPVLKVGSTTLAMSRHPASIHQILCETAQCLPELSCLSFCLKAARALQPSVPQICESFQRCSLECKRYQCLQEGTCA